MREILFKAKRIDNGEWVEGYYTYYPEGMDKSEDTKYCIRDTSTNPGKMYFVDPATICQYTGLTDKNGNKIWENDVVKHYNNPNEPEQFVKGVIYWNEENVRYERSSEYEHAKYSVLYDCVYEVIGNIFDDPELVKGGEE